jgi:hypothetical protein
VSIVLPAKFNIINVIGYGTLGSVPYFLIRSQSPCPLLPERVPQPDIRLKVHTTFEFLRRNLDSSNDFYLKLSEGGPLSARRGGEAINQIIERTIPFSNY